jgi:hypothetical protein
LYVIKVNVTLLEAFDDGVGAAGTAELVKDVSHVRFYGAQADKQFLRHFLIA